MKIGKSTQLLAVSGLSSASAFGLAPQPYIPPSSNSNSASVNLEKAVLSPGKQRSEKLNLASHVANSYQRLNSPISDHSLLTALNENRGKERSGKASDLENGCLMSGHIKEVEGQSSATDDRTVQLQSLSVKHPTYLSLGAIKQDENGEESRPLYITSFGLRETHVSEVPDVSKLVKDARSGEPLDPPKVLSTSFLWPNQVSEIPYEVFNRDNLLLVTDGFLMPFKNNGNVYVLDKETGEKFPLLESKRGWYYHEALFKDMNGDGVPDLLTARTNVFMLWKGKGELLWAEGREDMRSSPLSELAPLKEHVIGQGPDFFFSLNDIDGDGQLDIIAPEFSNEVLSVYKESKQEPGKWDRYEIADGIGPLFDVKVLNDHDEKVIFLTNHVNDLRASLMVLVRDPDHSPLTKEGWKKVAILEQIETRKEGPGQASPGSVALFYPKYSPEHESGGSKIPSLFLSGDGSGRAYILEPKDVEAGEWEYSMKIVVDEEGVMLGQPLAKELDGSGKTQLFMPVYEKDRIDIFDY